MRTLGRADRRCGRRGGGRPLAEGSVRCVEGSEFVAAHRLTLQSPSRRLATACCQTPMFSDFTKGFWVSIYRGRVTNAPAPSMRVMTIDALPGTTYSDDGFIEIPLSTASVHDQTSDDMDGARLSHADASGRRSLTRVTRKSGANPANRSSLENQRPPGTSTHVNLAHGRERGGTAASRTAGDAGVDQLAVSNDIPHASKIGDVAGGIFVEYDQIGNKARRDLAVAVTPP